MKTNPLYIGFSRWTLSFTTSAFFALPCFANAALVLSKGTGTSGTMEINSSFSFPITAAGQAEIIVFVDLLGAGFPHGIVYSQAPDQYPLPVSKVGSGTVFMAFQMDTGHPSIGDITSVDGGLQMIPESNGLPDVLPGDVVWIDSAFMTVGFAGFDPPAGSSYVFDGNAFLADALGNRLSDIVSIPEPATNLLSAIGVCLLATRRSRSGKR